MRNTVIIAMLAVATMGMCQCDPPEDLDYLQINSLVTTVVLSGSTGAATPVKLLDYDAGTLCPLHTDPISLSTLLTVSNNDQGEGALATDDGKYLFVAGYDAAASTSSVASTSSSSVERRVLRVGLDLSTAASDLGSEFSGVSARAGAGLGSLVWALSPNELRHAAFKGSYTPLVYQRGYSDPNLNSFVLDDGKITISRTSSGAPILRASPFQYGPGGTFGSAAFAPYETPEYPTAMLFRTDENYAYMFLCEHDSLYSYVRKYRWDEGNSYWDRRYEYATLLSGGQFLDLGATTTAVPVDIYAVTKQSLVRLADDGDSIDYMDSTAPPADHEYRGVAAIGTSLMTPPRVVAGTVRLEDLADESFGPIGRYIHLRFSLYLEDDEVYELVTSPDIEMDASNAGGQFSFTIPNGYGPGTYTLQCKGTFWLRDTIEIEIKELADGSLGCYNANFNLLNGDADMDNEVGIGDYALIADEEFWGTERDDRVGEGYYPDLNCDDAIDIADYAIIASNYTLSGDEEL